MALSAAQTKLYWRTWAAIAAAIAADLPDASKAEIAAQRKSQHKAAGCPASSKDWTNQDLTRWLYLEARINDPLNLQRLVEFEESLHPEAARIYVIRAELKKLGKPVSYAAACAHRSDLPQDLCKWPADALQAALMALRRTVRHQYPVKENRAQLPGEVGF